MPMCVYIYIYIYIYVFQDIKASLACNIMYYGLM